MNRLLAEAFITNLLNITKTQNLDEFDKHFCEDFPGLDGLKQWFGVLFSAFPDFDKRMELLIFDDQWVWGRFRITGTQTGPFLGHPATGKKIDFTSVDAWRFENGRVIEHWDVIDKLTMFEQLDLIPSIDPH